jgi:hypothetical protein
MGQDIEMWGAAKFGPVTRLRFAETKNGCRILLGNSMKTSVSKTEKNVGG